MKRLALFTACLMAVSLALGQGQSSAPPYQPAVPPPSIGYGGGGYGFGYGGGAGSTVQGSAMTGMANAIQRQGKLQPQHLGRGNQHDSGTKTGNREPPAIHQHLLRHAGNEQGCPCRGRRPASHGRASCADGARGGAGRLAPARSMT